MNIWEKLARCTSPGEIQRMVRGTNWSLVESDNLERLQSVSAKYDELRSASEAFAVKFEQLRQDYEALAEAAGETQIDIETIYDAAHALYMAGYWELPGQLPSEAQQAELWEDLRDALGLEAGGTTESDDEVLVYEGGLLVDDVIRFVDGVCLVPGDRILIGDDIHIIPGIVPAPEKVLVIDPNAITEPCEQDNIHDQLEEIISLLSEISYNTDDL